MAMVKPRVMARATGQGVWDDEFQPVLLLQLTHGDYMSCFKARTG